jgi:hypothetical protein
MDVKAVPDPEGGVVGQGLRLAVRGHRHGALAAALLLVGEGGAGGSGGGGPQKEGVARLSAEAAGDQEEEEGEDSPRHGWRLLCVCVCLGKGGW